MRYKITLIHFSSGVLENNKKALELFFVSTSLKILNFSAVENSQTDPKK